MLIKTVAKESVKFVGQIVLGQVVLFTTFVTMGFAGKVVNCIDIQPKCKKSEKEGA